MMIDVAAAVDQAQTRAFLPAARLNFAHLPLNIPPVLTFIARGFRFGLPGSSPFSPTYNSVRGRSP